MSTKTSARVSLVQKMQFGNERKKAPPQPNSGSGGRSHGCNDFPAASKSPPILRALQSSFTRSAYSGDSAQLIRRKAPGDSEGKRPVIPKDSALVFRLNRSTCSGRIGA